MKKLDTRRPHGTIAGIYSAIPEARYTQDGHFFNVNGDEVSLGETKQPEQKEAKPIEDQVTETTTTPTEEPTPAPVTNELSMDKTDEELSALAASGMGALRNYADNFGVKGTSKSEIVNELKALR